VCLCLAVAVMVGEVTEIPMFEVYWLGSWAEYQVVCLDNWVGLGHIRKIVILIEFFFKKKNPHVCLPVWFAECSSGGSPYVYTTDSSIRQSKSLNYPSNILSDSKPKLIHPTKLFMPN
jgi:hypothetical protein